MDYGKLLSGIENVPPGRILLRHSDGVETMLVTTSIEGAWGAPMLLQYCPSDDAKSGWLNAEDCWRDERFWDVTDIAEIRPNVRSRYFSYEPAKFAEVMVSKGGLLAISGDKVRGHRVSIKLADGLPSVELESQMLRFGEWRLVLIDQKTGLEAGELMKWSAPTEVGQQASAA